MRSNYTTNGMSFILKMKNYILAVAPENHASGQTITNGERLVLIPFAQDLTGNNVFDPSRCNFGRGLEHHPHSSSNSDGRPGVDGGPEHPPGDHTYPGGDGYSGCFTPEQFLQYGFVMEGSRGEICLPEGLGRFVPLIPEVQPTS